MNDSWELIDGEPGRIIEFLNYTNQINVIEAFVRYSLERFKIYEDGCCKGTPDKYILRELHRTATLFLLELPGQFRTEPVYVVGPSGTVYTPPEHDQVEGYLGKYFEELNARWLEMSAVEMGAFSLWFINWIHPFKNGNGRTARAFCYAAICLKFGFSLPGTPTLIDMIMEAREEYNAALAEADAGLREAGVPALGRMERYIGELLERQLSSVPLEIA